MMSGLGQVSVLTIDTLSGQNREKRHQCFVRLMMNARALHRWPLPSDFPRLPPRRKFFPFHFRVFRVVCGEFM